MRVHKTFSDTLVTLSPNHPKPTIVSTILKTEKDHLMFVILLTIMDLTHISYTSTIAKTATTLSWSHTQVVHYDVISLSLSF